MNRKAKFAIGLAAVLLLGWVHEGPLGNGEAYLASVERNARAVVASTNLTNIDVSLARAPQRRVAMLSGPADEFQRNGMGSFKGLTERVDDVPGVAAVDWTDDPRQPAFVLPLLAEILLLMCASYLLGVGMALWAAYRSREGRYA